MTSFRIEKIRNDLPDVRTPNTLYLVKDRYGRLDMFVTSDTADITITNQQELYTTPKIPVLNNRILLPLRPEGDVLFGIMIVYDEDGTITEYDSVTVVQDTYKSYAVLNEPYTITGFGVVSYLTRTQIT